MHRLAHSQAASPEKQGTSPEAHAPASPDSVEPRRFIVSNTGAGTSLVSLSSKELALSRAATFSTPLSERQLQSRGTSSGKKQRAEDTPPTFGSAGSAWGSPATHLDFDHSKFGDARALTDPVREESLLETRDPEIVSMEKVLFRLEQVFSALLPAEAVQAGAAHGGFARRLEELAGQSSVLRRPLESLGLWASLRCERAGREGRGLRGEEARALEELQSIELEILKRWIEIVLKVKDLQGSLMAQRAREKHLSGRLSDVNLLVQQVTRDRETLEKENAALREMLRAAEERGREGSAGRGGEGGRALEAACLALTKESSEAHARRAEAEQRAAAAEERARIAQADAVRPRDLRRRGSGWRRRSGGGGGGRELRARVKALEDELTLARAERTLMEDEARGLRLELEACTQQMVGVRLDRAELKESLEGQERAAEAAREALRGAEARLEEARGELEAERARKRRDEAEYDALRDRIRELEGERESLRSLVVEGDAQAAAARAEQARAQDELDRARALCRDLTERLARRLGGAGPEAALEAGRGRARSRPAGRAAAPGGAPAAQAPAPSGDASHRPTTPRAGPRRGRRRRPRDAGDAGDDGDGGAGASAGSTPARIRIAVEAGDEAGAGAAAGPAPPASPPAPGRRGEPAAAGRAARQLQLGSPSSAASASSAAPSGRGGAGVGGGGPSTASSVESAGGLQQLMQRTDEVISAVKARARALEAAAAAQAAAQAAPPPPARAARARHSAPAAAGEAGAGPRHEHGRPDLVFITTEGTKYHSRTCRHAPRGYCVPLRVALSMGRVPCRHVRAAAAQAASPDSARLGSGAASPAARAYGLALHYASSRIGGAAPFPAAPL
eukprot:tig00000983_g5920.t1